MNIAIGIILLVTFIAFIVYAVKGGNLMLGFLIMAILWTALGIIGGKITWDDAMAKIFEGGPESWGATAVVVIFGSWFGQVLVKTNIAATIIRKTVELGGDRAIITTMLLCVVTGLIFTSTFGAGAVIAIGVIVLPIMLSLGVPKNVAVSSYVMSVGSGMYVNMVLFKQMQGIFEGFKYDFNYLKFGFVAMAVQVVVVLIMLGVNLGGKKTVHAWAASTGAVEDNKPAPWYSLITPILPVVLTIAFKWQPIPAFLAAGFYALFVCGKIKSFKEATQIVSKTFYDGVVDVAALLGFLFILPMFNKVAGADSFFFQSIFGGIMPKQVLFLCLLFAVLAPLGLFRGPLTVFGAGAAVLGILNGMGIYSATLLFPLIYIPTITMNISSCPTQSWNLWAINYTKCPTREFLLTGAPWGWAICAINSMVVFFMYGIH